MENNKSLNYSSAVAALFIGGIIMGFSPVFVRFAEVDAFASAFWRVFFALPILFAWLLWDSVQNQTPLELKFTVPGILAGIFFSGDLVFWHLSILNTTIANATFMVCLAPLWVMLFSKILLGEPQSMRNYIGLGFCLLGLLLLINASVQYAPERLLGDIYGLITSVFLGLYFLAMRFGRKTTSGSGLFFTSTCITLFVLFIIALFMSTQFFPDTINGWSSLISLGVLTHAGGQGLVTMALGVLSAMFSSLVIFIEALAAAVFGWWLLDENLTFMQLAGGMLILIGMWISRPTKTNSS